MLTADVMTVYWQEVDMLRERVLEALRTKGKVENFELHVKRADGTPFWVETSFEPTTFEGEPAIFAGYIDITERLKIEVLSKGLPLFSAAGAAGLAADKVDIGIPGMLFEEFGFTYLGPIDGHDINQLVDDTQVAIE